MNTVDALPKKLGPFVCRDCGLKSSAPIVKAVPNPKHDADGRCSNTQACAKRVRHNERRTAAKEKSE